MKKTVYITAVLALSLTVSSCQKDEFNDILIDKSAENIELRDGCNDTYTPDDKLTSSKETSSDKPSDKIDPKKGGFTGLVKEISDGDDESDNDQNTTN